MEQQGVRNVNVSPARGLDPQAKVHVVEGDGDVLVETADGVELMLFDHQACSCYGTNKLRHVRHSEISWFVGRKEAMRMAGSLSNSNDNSRMLDASVFV